MSSGSRSYMKRTRTELVFYHDSDPMQVEAVAIQPTPLSLKLKANSQPLKTRTASSEPSRKRQVMLPPVASLPNEILLLVFDMLPSEDLLSLRLVSKGMGLLSEATLYSRFHGDLSSLQESQKEAHMAYADIEREKRPHLRHYRQFLRQPTITDLTEATWYTTPPQELQTVCECLCLLKGITPSRPGSAKTSPNQSSLPPLIPPTLPDEPMTWANIKKTMSRYDFKTWLLNLRFTVDHIPIAHVKRVERIVMMDAAITYERLREVSMAGYRLLIIVAACLQYCTIHEEIRRKRQAAQDLDGQLRRLTSFLTCLNGRRMSRSGTPMALD